MKATLRLLLACGAFLAVALTGCALILLDWIARPLRYVNVQCLAALAAIHAQEFER